MNRGILLRAGVIVTAVLAFVGVLTIANSSPPKVLWLFLTGGGTKYGIAEAIAKMTPILLCALAAAIPARMGLINIGGEGQFLMGTIGATLVALVIPDASSLLLLPLMACGAAILAGVWGLIPAVLKTATRASETVISLLMNYVSGLFVLYLIHGPLKDPTSMGWPQSAAFSANATLPCIPTTRIHPVILVALAFAILLAWVAQSTIIGMSSKIIRTKPAVARYAGIPLTTYYVFGFVLAGALAGIAGFGEISAVHGRLREGISLGYGYAGFFVAWLCRNSFLACVPASILFALIVTGADALQISAGLPFATIYFVQGLLFVIVLAVQRPANNGSEAR